MCDVSWTAAGHQHSGDTPVSCAGSFINMSDGEICLATLRSLSHLACQSQQSYLRNFLREYRAEPLLWLVGPMPH